MLTLQSGDAAAQQSAPEPLPLSFDQRSRSRYRLRLADGREVAWALDAGCALAHRDLLRATSGESFIVQAAEEALLQARSDDPHTLARAAWHLGNRHVRIEVGHGYLCLQPDSVLAAMLAGLGLSVTHINAPFHPESGAYAGGHRHGHADTFGSDYALAQAVFELRESSPPQRPAPLSRRG